MHNEKEHIQGGCHCKKIQWQVALPISTTLNCHCNMCRNLSGADYSTWVVIPEDNFRIISGENLINNYQATEEFSKFFCKTCSSTVYCINNNKFPEHIYVAKGNITTDVEIPLELQVYTQDKVKTVALDDDVPLWNPKP